MTDECAGWKREAERLLALANKLQGQADECTAWKSIVARIEKMFGCNHTAHGPEDSEAIVRHVSALLESRNKP